MDGINDSYLVVLDMNAHRGCAFSFYDHAVPSGPLQAGGQFASHGGVAYKSCERGFGHNMSPGRRWGQWYPPGGPEKIQTTMSSWSWSRVCALS